MKLVHKVEHCESMADVRRNIDALDLRIVALIAERSGYVAQAARVKAFASLFGGNYLVRKGAFLYHSANFVRPDLLLSRGLTTGHKADGRRLNEQ